MAMLYGFMNRIQTFHPQKPSSFHARRLEKDCLTTKKETDVIQTSSCNALERMIIEKALMNTASHHQDTYPLSEPNEGCISMQAMEEKERGSEKAMEMKKKTESLTIIYTYIKGPSSSSPCNQLRNTSARFGEDLVTIAERYVVDRTCLGSGGFGEVYMGQDKDTGAHLAIKIEPKELGALEQEAKVYDHMWENFSELVGYPRVHWYGQYEDCNVLVMDRLGKTILDHMEELDCRLSIKTVLMVGIQAIQRLQTIHNADYVHRDMKPENIMLGLDESRTIYFVDLGLAKRYRSIETKKHRSLRDGTMVGTVPFLSMNVHDNTEASRRDDLASLAYVLVFMFKGRLPWYNPVKSIGSDGNTKEDMSVNETWLSKLETRTEDLFEGMPRQMAEFFDMVDMLEFEEVPDYGRYMQLFEEALSEGGFSNDRKFDWDSLRELTSIYE